MNGSRKRICIIGAGAIGGWIAARLAAGGNQVAAVTSRGPLDHVEVSEGETNWSVGLSSFDDPAEIAVVAVKANALEAAAKSSRRWIDEATTIVPMLNGVPWWFLEGHSLRSVDPDGTVDAAFPLRQLVGCVVHASCYRSGPASIVVKHVDKLILGEPAGGTSERVEILRDIFESSGIACAESDNVRRAIWYKLWGNATINPLSALTRASCDRILADDACRAWMLEGMSELAALGAAIGCPISESGEDRMAVTARLGAFKTSMLQDVEAGRRIELEALLGAPREIARKFGMPTPALDRLYGVTRLMADSIGLG